MVMTILLVSACTILNLNLLIGILSHSYDKIQGSVDKTIYLEKCHVMKDQFYFFYPKVLEYVYTLKRIDDVVEADNVRKETRKFDVLTSNELMNKVNDLETTVADIKTKMGALSALQGDVAEVKSLLAKLVASQTK